jgi:hypothetical protein
MRLGVNQPKVSAVKGYKLARFSVERLMHFATALEHDVVMEIRPHAAAEGAARVVFMRLAISTLVMFSFSIACCTCHATVSLIAIARVSSPGPTWLANG